MNTKLVSRAQHDQHDHLAGFDTGVDCILLSDCVTPSSTVVLGVSNTGKLWLLHKLGAHSMTSHKPSLERAVHALS